MHDLRSLYQEVIVDHTRSPRNFHEMPEANHHAEGFNPLCGDRLTLYLKINDQHYIEEASFVGSGCSISTASASLMTEALKGKTITEAKSIFNDFHHMLLQEGDGHEAERLGKLAVFAGVCEYPARVKCATLAWHTFVAALEDSHKIISTEDEQT